MLVNQVSTDPNCVNISKMMILYPRDLVTPHLRLEVPALSPGVLLLLVFGVASHVSVLESIMASHIDELIVVPGLRVKFGNVNIGEGVVVVWLVGVELVGLVAGGVVVVVLTVLRLVVVRSDLRLRVDEVVRRSRELRELMLEVFRLLCRRMVVVRRWGGIGRSGRGVGNVWLGFVRFCRFTEQLVVVQQVLGSVVH